MKKLFIFALVAILPAAQTLADGHGQRAQQSREVIKTFFAELKGELQNAIKEGGPVKAIEVCNSKSPEITQRLSQEKGWSIGRTSLKLRNPANAPDAWEKAVLEEFEARKAAGEDPQKLEHYEVVTQNGVKQFRYMKAIPTAKKPCLVCHGENLKPEVAAALDKLYPTDQARGYREGDIRGAFTITQPM